MQRESVMSESTPIHQLTQILREVFDNDDLVATPTLTAAEVQGWDSLGNVRLFIEIERAFSIRFNALETTSLKNVGELAALIEKKLNQ
jgi:acyl carrier protein